MDNGEKMLALENMIFQYAVTQFNANQTNPSQARMIMNGVVCRIQAQCIDNLIMSRVSFQQKKEEEHEE